MDKLLSTAALALLTLGGAATPAGAAGCYVCGQGSAAACRDYCRYDGADTFDSRHRCEARGCRVSGASSCPGPGDARVCEAPRKDHGTVAAQCLPPPRAA